MQKTMAASDTDDAKARSDERGGEFGDVIALRVALDHDLELMRSTDIFQPTRR